jgi:5-methylcytosine-specific restriction protein A
MISYNIIILVVLVVFIFIFASNTYYSKILNRIYKTIKKIPSITIIILAIIAFFGIKIYNPINNEKIEFDGLTDFLNNRKSKSMLDFFNLGSQFFYPNKLNSNSDVNSTSDSNLNSNVNSTSNSNFNFNPTSTSNSKQRYKRNVSESKKKFVAARQQWKCAICGCLLDETYEVDHLIPLYEGGSNENDNLIALDPICHRKKTNANRENISIENHFNHIKDKFCQSTPYYYQIKNLTPK